jgi:hypothetical protein
MTAADYHWVSVSPDSTLENAEGGFAFHYDAGAGSPHLAVLPGRGAEFGSAKSIRFELKTDSPFAVAMVLAEKKPDGGNYSSVVWSNGDSWQPVVLSLADFSPTEGANDPVDKDGKLDADQIENAAFVDFSQFLQKMGANSQIYAEPHQGAHLISVRNFEISGEAASNDRPQSSWFSPGGATFEQSGGAVTVRYREQPEKWTAFVRTFPPHDYSGAAHLSMDIQSDKDVQLVISIAERKGERHNVDFMVPAGTKPEHRDVDLKAFEGEINLKAIQSIAILDVSGEAGVNKIVIKDLRLN